MRRMELLAPAGGREQLEYAIRFGADAVYLALSRFGMRQRADNFRMDELPDICAYAHERGAKVHVTCNTVMHDGDFKVLPEFFERVQAAGADALIISDLGAFKCARTYAPGVDLHVSTQASVSNAETAKVWAELGAKRIVLARELSLEQIAAMRAELPHELELETFVHGSMCMAISGRCMISDYLTGRSALTGHCTQPCRWSYTLEEERRPGEHFPVAESEKGTFIFNSKDLNMLSHLDDLAAAGIDSIKIEGRNKKAFYVATVVNAYRKVLDGADPAAFEPELNIVSHRPYHTGFYYGPSQQSPESDAYIRTHEWAAIVDECRAGDDGHKLFVTCRNRFDLESELTAMQPRGPVVPVQVASISYLPYGDESLAEPVAVANRNMEQYVLKVDAPVEPKSMLRVKRTPK